MMYVLKKILKRIGFSRKYNEKTFLIECYLGKRKIYEYFGVKFLPTLVECQNAQVLNQLNVLMNICPDVHTQVFEKYRDAFVGREVVILATGETINRYKKIENAIHIGVNRAITKFDLDYYFMGDWTAIQKYGIEQEIVQSNAKKFFVNGVLDDEFGTTSFSPPLDFCKKVGASMFFSFHYASHQIIQKDITKFPLFGWGSIITCPFHFALFARPKRIFLVGCDVGGGHIKKGEEAYPDLAQIRLRAEWNRMALFAKYHYPDVEIISINPVGLKGLFKDEYR